LHQPWFDTNDLNSCEVDEEESPLLWLSKLHLAKNNLDPHPVKKFLRSSMTIIYTKQRYIYVHTYICMWHEIIGKLKHPLKQAYMYHRDITPAVCSVKNVASRTLNKGVGFTKKHSIPCVYSQKKT